MLVHGLAGSSDWWRGTVGELSQEREVHAVAVPRLSIARVASSGIASVSTTPAALTRNENNTQARKTLGC